MLARRVWIGGKDRGLHSTRSVDPFFWSLVYRTVHLSNGCAHICYHNGIDEAWSSSQHASEQTGVEQLVLGLYIIRGDNISVVGELDEELDSNLDLTKLRAHPLKPGGKNSTGGYQCAINKFSIGLKCYIANEHQWLNSRNKRACILLYVSEVGCHAIGQSIAVTRVSFENIGHLSTILMAVVHCSYNSCGKDTFAADAAHKCKTALLT
eukprot:Gb_28265 [translate_table: standard]